MGKFEKEEKIFRKRFLEKLREREKLEEKERKKFWENFILS